MTNIKKDVKKHYDRDVRWENERLDVKGRQWKSAYLPVWLYSYQQVKSENDKDKKRCQECEIFSCLIFAENIREEVVQIFNTGFDYILKFPRSFFKILFHNK